MYTARLQQALQPILSQYIGAPVSSLQWQPVGGGSINHTYKITVNNHIRFFAKINSATRFPLLFEKEKNGLHFISRQHIVKTPQVVDCRVIDDLQILVLEWIDEGERTKDFWRRFGAQLAALHHVSGSSFGLEADNYMGS